MRVYVCVCDKLPIVIGVVAVLRRLFIVCYLFFLCLIPGVRVLCGGAVAVVAWRCCFCMYILSAIRLGRRQGINNQTEARLVVFVAVSIVVVVVVADAFSVGSTMEF